MQKNIITKNKALPINSKLGAKFSRAARLRTKLQSLLGEAKTHPEIQKLFPELKPFFRKITPDDFILLIDSCDAALDPVHIALWYHYGEVLDYVVNQCPIAYDEAMKEIYPLLKKYSERVKRYA